MKKNFLAITASVLFVALLSILLWRIHPAVELVFSISIRLLSAVIALYLAIRYRELRVSFIAVMFLGMAIRQFLTLLLRAGVIERSAFTVFTSELPGFVVTILVLISVIYIGVLLSGIRKRDEKINKLEEILPICCVCKKIRLEGADPQEQETWEEVEEYIAHREATKFSHCYCPDCYEKEINRIEKLEDD